MQDLFGRKVRYGRRQCTLLVNSICKIRCLQYKPFQGVAMNGSRNRIAERHREGGPAFRLPGSLSRTLQTWVLDDSAVFRVLRGSILQTSDRRNRNPDLRVCLRGFRSVPLGPEGRVLAAFRTSAGRSLRRGCPSTRRTARPASLLLLFLRHRRVCFPIRRKAEACSFPLRRWFLPSPLRPPLAVYVRSRGTLSSARSFAPKIRTKRSAHVRGSAAYLPGHCLNFLLTRSHFCFNLPSSSGTLRQVMLSEVEYVHPCLSLVCPSSPWRFRMPRTANPRPSITQEQKHDARMATKWFGARASWIPEGPSKDRP